MSITDKIASGFKAQLSSQFIAAVVGGSITVVLARLLTPSEYGIFFLAISVFSLFKVGTRLGIARSTGRYIAEYKEKNPDQVIHILLTGLAVNFVTIGIAVIVLVFGHSYIAGLLNEPELTSLLLFGTLYLFFSTLAKFLSKVWQGFEEIKLASFIEICSQVGRLVFAIGFVALGYGAMGALGGYTLSNVVAVSIGSVILYKNHFYLQESASMVESGLRRRIVEYSIPITVTNTANTLEKEVDTVLIGFFLTPIAVSHYVIGKQVVKFIETPMSALGFTLSPTFGAQKAEDNIERASRIYETALRHILLLYIPAGAGIILVAEPFIGLFFGTEYSGAIPVLQILGIFVVLKAITKLSGDGLDFLGRARDRAVVKTVTSVLNIILNIVLIPAIGVVGAAIATVITFSMYTFVTLLIIYQEFDINAKLVAQEVGLIGIITAVMSTAVLVFLEYIQGWFSLFFAIGIGVLVWIVLSTITGLLDIKRVTSMMS